MPNNFAAGGFRRRDAADFGERGIAAEAQWVIADRGQQSRSVIRADPVNRSQLRYSGSGDGVNMAFQALSFVVEVAAAGSQGFQRNSDCIGWGAGYFGHDECSAGVDEALVVMPASSCHTSSDAVIMRLLSATNALVRARTALPRATRSTPHHFGRAVCRWRVKTDR